LNEKQKSEKKIYLFLSDLYTALENKIVGLQDTMMEDKTTKSQSLLYKLEVYNLLLKAKSQNDEPLSDIDLRNLQMQIEDSSMKFDESTIYKSNLIKILIQKDRVSAKDYLLEKLADDEKQMLDEFGQYTLEALIIYVMSLLFSTAETMVRASSFIDQLNSSVRTHSRLLNSHSSRTSSVQLESKNQYSFGVFLLEFMKERELVSIMTIESGGGVKKKSKGSYYYPSNVFIVCKFDLSLLPIKLNLPMICPPLDWQSTSSEAPRYLSDLSGGYLSGPTGEIYDRYRLLSSGNLNHFYIQIGGNQNNYQSLCDVMNVLQRQPFTINSDWLNYLLSNEDSFVDMGLLMPKFLASLNISDVYQTIREFHMKSIINKEITFNDLLNTVLKTIQRSRYERLILNLARAYDGYHFYLPAFLDFRGRIYRCGILHFHERDLARSLIVFADSHNKNYNDNYKNYDSIALFATLFHFDSFTSTTNAKVFLNENYDNITKNFITFSIHAKRPFQFCANMFSLMNGKIDYFIDKVPITQDAASSAYQIMSYFLLDETLAKRTNLFSSMDGEIKDVYSFFLKEFMVYIPTELEPNLCSVVSMHINRKIVKSIFMPMIYGKTMMSTATDLMEHFSQHLTRKECFSLAKVCFKFFKELYPGMDNLIRLISLIGWVSSAKGRAVTYKVSYFTTVQDYHKMEPIYIWVYDRLHKKKRRVTLRVSSDKRDHRKTETSTFVNFIHQKDAFIAMNVVKILLELNIPIYTVHDNFITTVANSNLIPLAYLCVFRCLGPPLSIINKFIYMNVSSHLRNDDENRVISKKFLLELLNQNIPENISKQKKKIWDKKISEIVTCYSNYVKIVCGKGHSYNELWKSHEEKWEEFSAILQSGDGESFCVHY